MGDPPCGLGQSPLACAKGWRARLYIIDMTQSLMNYAHCFADLIPVARSMLGSRQVLLCGHSRPGGGAKVEAFELGGSPQKTF
jgi:pimeloyl-ACP methyl ester carboxylesterase